MENSFNNKESKKAPLANIHPAIFIVIILIATFITYQVFNSRKSFQNKNNIILFTVYVYTFPCVDIEYVARK
ncbi:MAG: hypothetical protein NTU73_02130 [Ignavibacteriae bacterium]|nr:hypothetical protein [Ignavibacteriota bacterium]